jgi:AcrR family transcriptional regulator
MNDPSPGGRRRGRRPAPAGGPPATHAALLKSARRAFLAQGYDGATVRAIAAEAGVDAALIAYFFGSKRGLFSAAMALEVDPATTLRSLLPGPPDELGGRILRRLLGVWDDPASGSPLRVLMAAAATESRAAVMLREYLQAELLDPLATHLTGLGARDGDLGARRAGVLLLGLIQARYVLRLEPLASADPEDVEELLAGLLQHALGDPADG